MNEQLSFFFMMAIIFAIFYFLLIRPQQQRIKAHREMVSAVRRGDTVVTSGGIVGKISKVIDDNEALVEIAEGVKVKVIKHTLTDVLSKSEPASADPKSKS